MKGEITMNEYKIAYFIGAAETAAYTAGRLFHSLPEFAEMSIKLAYCYLLAANGQIEVARKQLLNEPLDTKELFESVLEHAEQVCRTFES